MRMAEKVRFDACPREAESVYCEVRAGYALEFQLVHHEWLRARAALSGHKSSRSKANVSRHAPTSQRAGAATLKTLSTSTSLGRYTHCVLFVTGEVFECASELVAMGAGGHDQCHLGAQEQSSGAQM